MGKATSRPPLKWRSLEELAGDEEFLSAVETEFAPGAEFWVDDASRREFLKRMTASFALAGLAGCTQAPQEKIIPYVETPETLVPGVPLFYATAMPQSGGAIGILVESHEGHPTKVEGNKLHPASEGATDTFSQASVLDLYDPHRSKVVRRGGEISSWTEFAAALQSQIAGHQGDKGEGLHLVTPAIISPTLQFQISQLLSKLPEAKWYQIDSTSNPAVKQGVELATGTEAVPYHSLNDADVIFSLDADFLGEDSARVRLAREFASRRKVEKATDTMNRLYVAEPTPTLTGAAADHCLRLAPGKVRNLLVMLARELGVAVSGIESVPVENARRWIEVLAEDLRNSKGRSLVLAGPSQPAEVHALCYLINESLQNLGTTVKLIEPIDRVEGHSPLTAADLADSLKRGEVESLFVLESDLFYNVPEMAGLQEKIANVPFSVHHSRHLDETSQFCLWHLPLTHFLEEWSDTRSEDGTVSLIQPLVHPLYDGRSHHDLINLLLGESSQTSQETVQAFWKDQFNGTSWEESLHNGVVAGTSFKPIDVTRSEGAVGRIADSWNAKQPATEKEFAVVFRHDPSLLDGRFTTNGWLQELPKPFTKMTWGNAAWVSQATADELSVKTGDVIEIKTASGTVQIPVWILPGQPDKVVTLHIGNGRYVDGHELVGVNVNSLRESIHSWTATASLRSTGERAVLPTTQHHFQMENRDLIRRGTLEEFAASPDHPSFMTPEGHHGHGEGEVPSFYAEPEYVGPQWGMSVNLGACTGCNACVVACQSENNTPVVGPDQVARGREMHWLRIDSYFSGDAETAEVHHQPVMCMHCEFAPCEPVCPVGATTHSDDGLNEMTYNRCIGTRYCSNNCPYKVRRFNFLDYREEVTEFPVLELLQNPNVSVRSRGVMEKCTYCVQRISSARIEAKMEDREIRDGEVVTACQSVCPTQAIVFGDITDPDSQIAQAKEHPLDYGLLTELNTRPRTSYLAALRNPNPKLVSAAKEEHE